MSIAPRFRDVLETLTRHEVEFLVVGGVAAVMWGAPISTFDLDIVYRRTDENLNRLTSALHELEAIYRDPAGRRIEPNPARLAGGGHQLLMTRLGPVDALGRIGADLSYDELLPRARELELSGMRLLVLELAAIIETKEHAGRDKDRAVLEILRETLRMMNS